MRNELLAIDDAALHLSIVRKIATQAGFETTGADSVGEAAGCCASVPSIALRSIFR